MCLLAGRVGVMLQYNATLDTGQVELGQQVAHAVPPGVFWRSRLLIQQPHFLKFNISIQKNALIGVYGRRGLPPSHTQVKQYLCYLITKSSNLILSHKGLKLQ